MWNSFVYLERCQRSVWHVDLQLEVDGDPGYFIIDNGSEQSSIYVFPGSHLYIRYHYSRKEKLSEALPMHEIKFVPMSLSIGHGNIQHAGFGWKGKHSMRYHM